jgi:hypothetical protein
MTPAQIARWLFGIAGAAAALLVHRMPAPAERGSPPRSGTAAVAARPSPVAPPLAVAPAALPATGRRPRPEPADATPVAIVPADAALVDDAAQPGGSVPGQARPAVAATPARSVPPIPR